MTAMHVSPPPCQRPALCMRCAGIDHAECLHELHVVCQACAVVCRIVIFGLCVRAGGWGTAALRGARARWP